MAGQGILPARLSCSVPGHPPPRVISAPASRAWDFLGISGSPFAGAVAVSSALAAGTFPFFTASPGMEGKPSVFPFHRDVPSGFLQRGVVRLGGVGARGPGLGESTEP